LYDFLFLTHLPSFYKLNLYRELSAKHRVGVICLGGGSLQRNEDFVKSDSGSFDIYFLSKGDFELRNKLKTSRELLKILGEVKYKNILVGGWEEPEFWLAVIKSGKNRSSLVLESTIFESKLSAVHCFIKRIFCRLILRAFPAGMPHMYLLKALDFKGEMCISGGVGLVNESVLSDAGCKRRFNNKLLFVGRLSKEKNIDFLIDAVNRDEMLSLTIVGDGDERDRLESISCDRISFIGYIDNSKLSDIYEDAGAIVLTSHRETWGLVVEEAAYNGCPAIVNSGVGCYIDFVLNEGVGLVYQSNDVESFKLAIDRMRLDAFYSSMIQNCNRSLFLKRRDESLRIFSSLLG
jgi:glycosyltransferase involved in cell wall biosynthesis